LSSEAGDQPRVATGIDSDAVFNVAPKHHRVIPHTTKTNTFTRHHLARRSPQPPRGAPERAPHRQHEPRSKAQGRPGRRRQHPELQASPYVSKLPSPASRLAIGGHAMRLTARGACRRRDVLMRRERRGGAWPRSAMLASSLSDQRWPRREIALPQPATAPPQFAADAAPAGAREMDDAADAPYAVFAAPPPANAAHACGHDCAGNETNG
jgi:hypothetical protein